MAPAGPTKSELKAIKKRDIERKKKLKALGPDAVLSEDEDDEPIVTGKVHPDGELVDDLESDDFAFGSGEDDDLDGLSTMSEWSDDPEIDTGDSMSDLGSGEEDDDDEEGLWSDEDDSDLGSVGGDSADGSGPAFDSEEEVGSVVEEDEEASTADDEGEEEDQDLSRAAKKAKKRAAAADLDDLESKYEASRPLHKVKEPKALPTKLPTIVNGKVVRSNEVLDGAPVEDSDEEDDELLQEEERSQQAPEYKSDPLGQRFGRPAVRQLLEIKDKKERIRRAREEIADLGREAAGTGEGEGGVSPALSSSETHSRPVILTSRGVFLSSSTFSVACCPYAVPNSTRRRRPEAQARRPSLSTARSGSWPWSACSQSSSMWCRECLSTSESRRTSELPTDQAFAVARGYRIRELSEAEREVQVSQLVARQREWENGLVSTYKKFLEICAAEIKGACRSLSWVSFRACSGLTLYPSARKLCHCTGRCALLVLADPREARL